MNLMVTVFVCNFLADWVFQPPKMGREKSNNINTLGLHILIIFATVFAGALFHLDFITALLLSALNAATHAIIDWNIWRGYKYYVYFKNRHLEPVLGRQGLINKLKRTHKYWIDPVFGYILGFDQLLHFVILYVIFS